MTREIPGPLRAAAGLAALAVDEARRLPTRLAGLPVLAVGAAMQASMRAQQRYAELVGRGEQVLSHLREPDEQPPWARFDEDDSSAAANGSGDWAFTDDQLEERIGELDEEPGDDAPDEDLYAPSSVPGGDSAAAGDPATADPASADATRPAAGVNGQRASAVADALATGAAKSRAAKRPRAAARTSKDSKDDKAGKDDRVSKPVKSARGTKATKVAKATRATKAAPAELPLANYDSLTLPQLRARIAKLNAGQLDELLRHERAHGARAPYLTMLENRLGRLGGN